MATMGRRRKNPDHGLQPRVYLKHGAFYYEHALDRRWEALGKDKDVANAKARLYNDPNGRYGTLVYWLEMFIADCERRVKLKSTVKGVKLSQRSLEDYRHAVYVKPFKKPPVEATRVPKTGALSVYFKPPMTPLDVTGDMVQDFLKDGAEVGRSTRANRDKACLSACFTWLLQNKRAETGLQLNPCLRSAGVQRNPEGKRQRYVTHDEYREVFDVATRSERLMMALTYRTLQRPESDIVLWDTSIITRGPNGRRRLVFVQHKTGQRMAIEFSPEMEKLIPKPVGNVHKLHEPLVRRLDGGFYTYDGLCGMLKKSIDTANVRRAARGIAPMPSFGYRDLKGKGATDMYYVDKVPLADIQQLLGHANQSTTEIYIKQRWQQVARPNTVVMK